MKTFLKFICISFFLGIPALTHSTTPAPASILIKDTLEFTSSNLPIIVINTNGMQIRDEPRIIVDMGIIDNGNGQRNNLTDPFNDYNGKIGIEFRGSATAAYPKKQYRIETVDSNGENLNVSLMGLPKENDWILYGPYTDDISLMRHILAYRLSNEIGRYASRTRLCELVLNDDYRGLYVLMEKIKQDKNRVDIAKLLSTDISGDDVTGGYIIKVDKSTGANVGGWQSENHVNYQYHDPQADELADQQKQYIKNFMNTFESCMANLDDNEQNDIPAYAAFIDVPSFVDHFLLNEFCKNVDAYRISAFLYKEKDSKGGKLFAGPVWDFNLSFGNAWYEDDYMVTNTWQVDYTTTIRPSDGYRVPFWWPVLARDQAFVELMLQRWNDLKYINFSKDHLYTVIDNLVTVMSEARQRNTARWPAMADYDYDAEITTIKQWISDRRDWMDTNLGLLSSGTTANTSLAYQFDLLQNYPNPFNPSTIISLKLLTKAQVELKVYNSLGQEVTTLVNGIISPTLSYPVEFNAAGLPCGVYIYQLKANNYVICKKMLLIR